MKSHFLRFEEVLPRNNVFSNGIRGQPCHVKHTLWPRNTPLFVQACDMHGSSYHTPWMNVTLFIHTLRPTCPPHFSTSSFQSWKRDGHLDENNSSKPYMYKCYEKWHCYYYIQLTVNNSSFKFPHYFNIYLNKLILLQPFQ